MALSSTVRFSSFFRCPVRPAMRSFWPNLIYAAFWLKKVRYLLRAPFIAESALPLSLVCSVANTLARGKEKPGQVFVSMGWFRR